MQSRHNDYVVIDTYDSATGVVTIAKGLEFYHYGHFDVGDVGVDMRGEVILLSRNVRVVGDPYDAWGCTFIATDYINSDGSMQAANVTIDNVEFYNCSQRNTYKAAIRFENVISMPQNISNSVVHGSLAWGLYIKSSSLVEVTNTSFIGAKAVGVNLHAVTNVKMANNIVADVSVRLMEAIHLVDKEAAYAICSYNDGDKCTGLDI